MFVMVSIWYFSDSETATDGRRKAFIHTIVKFIESNFK